MKLLAPITAILAAASATQVYQHQAGLQQVQPIESYAHTAELYQNAQEFQQQGLYSGQSHGFDQQESYQSRPSGEKAARILHHNMENDGHNYQYAYETENGIRQHEVGQTIDGTKAQGEYSYTGDDGQVYAVSYTADENGFRAQGAHLPTPPPLPEAIAKSLEQNAKDEASGVFDDGKYRPEADDSYHQEQQQYQQSDFDAHFQQNVGYVPPQVQNAQFQYLKH
ncbi:cuticle protein 3-like [Ostrinia furnacalis]|uniref:cuticle protein 3-like n=1 Tax=Ostrinia furnacalis TaxID=93504 RepID=UPI00103F6B65|nr:cuticle protein 3-like [Ostrinia furnacalis]